MDGARELGHSRAEGRPSVEHEPTTAVYEALDERGLRVLDALEERLPEWRLGIELEAHTRRRRLYSGSGLTSEPSALDRQLSALDPSWHEHVVRLV